MIDLSKITLGQYAPRDSFIHRLDPRTKLIIALAWMTLSLSWHHFPAYIGSLFILSLLYAAARLSLKLMWRNIQSFLWLLFFTLLIHLFFTDGFILFRIPLFHWIITREGVSNGLFYCLRIILLILLANWLTLTTSPMAFTDALERLLKPLRRIRVPSHEIAMMISISLRFIPVLLEEVERIEKAQISRGARFDGNWIQRIRCIIPIVIPLFISTFRRADEMAMAMDARCYRGGEHRTSYHVLALRIDDWIVMIIIFLCMLCSLTFRF